MFFNGRWLNEPCSSNSWQFIEIGLLKIWFIEIGSSKIWFIEIGSSKSGSLKSVHWKSCLGDVHSPKIKLCPGRHCRPMSRLLS
jgi:hypothetical protein